MRPKSLDIYLTILFIIISFSNWNFNILGVDVIGLSIWIISLGMFAWVIAPLLKKKPFKPTPEIVIALVYFTCEILLVLLNLFSGRLMSFRSPLMLSILFISLTILIGQSCGSRFLFIASVVNLMVHFLYIFCALGIFEKPPFAQGVLNDAGLCSWIVMSLCINVLGYCVEVSMKVWYSVCLFVGSFALFLEKNTLSILIVSILFLGIIFAFAESYQTVKSILILYFVHIFLFANMSLIVNSGLHFVRVTPYSIETSVYLELIIALVALILCNIGDYWVKKALKIETITKHIRTIALVTVLVLILSIAFFITLNFTVASDTMPELFSKVGNYLSKDISQVQGFWKNAFCDQRIALLATAIYYIAMALLFAKRAVMKGIRHKASTYTCFSLVIVYFVQFICLPQSLEVNFLYGVVLFRGFAALLEEKRAPLN